MFCIKCGKQLPDDAKFCINCGTPMPELIPAAEPAPVVEVAPIAEVAPVEEPAPVAEEPAPIVDDAPKCANCGAALKEGMKFCTSCGTAVAAAPAEEPTPVVEVAPIVEEIAPVVEEPAPVAEEPAPIVDDAPKCANCGAALKEGMKFCTSCGTPVVVAAVSVAAVAEPAPVAEEPAPVAPSTPKCANCGAELNPGIKFCTSCGTAVAAAPIAAAPIVTPVPAKAKKQKAEKPAKEKKAKAPKAKKERSGKKSGGTVVIAILAVIILFLAGFVGYKFYENDFSFDGLFEDILDFDNFSFGAKETATKDEDDELQEKYEAALEHIANKEYDEALELFEELDDYEDSAEQAKKLKEQKKNYENALKLMEDGILDDARRAFEALGDYADSQKYASELKKQENYDAAQSKASSATSVADWVAAAEAFTALGDYKDSAVQASACYLEAATLALADGDAAAAEDYYEKLNDADKAIYDSANSAYSVLAAWAESLAVRKDLQQNQNIWDQYDDELEHLYSARNLNCSDSRLMQLLNDYIAAVEAEKDNESNPDDDYMLIWYQNEYTRSNILDTLSQEYNFLANNSELYDWCIGKTDVCYACLTVEGALYDWYGSANLQYNYTYNSYYVDYENKTDYAIYIEFTFYYYDWSGNVISSETISGNADAWGSYELSLDAPSNFYSWDVDYTFYLN